MKRSINWYFLTAVGLLLIATKVGEYSALAGWLLILPIFPVLWYFVTKVKNPYFANTEVCPKCKGVGRIRKTNVQSL